MHQIKKTNAIGSLNKINPFYAQILIAKLKVLLLCIVTYKTAIKCFISLLVSWAERRT